MVEASQRTPTVEFCRGVDNVLTTDGRFERMRDRLLRTETPEWFRPWVEGYEQEAAEIRWYEPLLIPGLVQTEAYAAALLGDDSLVAARLGRQSVLDQAAVTVIVEEGVLRRKIGSADVMTEQLRTLAGSGAAMHVLPIGAATRRQYDGSFALANVDTQQVGYTDTPAEGRVHTAPGVLSDLRQRWEGLLAESLPQALSRELVMKEAERWNTES